MYCEKETEKQKARRRWEKSKGRKTNHINNIFSVIPQTSNIPTPNEWWNTPAEKLIAIVV